MSAYLIYLPRTQRIVFATLESGTYNPLRPRGFYTINTLILYPAE